MERKKWATAIRCLEIALHPNTSDDEAIASVNGFRRIAGGTPLAQICAELANGGPVASPAERNDKFDQLTRENLELRQKLQRAEYAQMTTVSQLAEMERRFRQLDEELRAAQNRANAAEKRLTGFSSTYAEIADGLKRESFNLRMLSEQTPYTAPELKVTNGAPPFSEFLATARQDAEQAQTHPPLRAQGREGRDRPVSGFGLHTPWTA
jgi:hypothetical protein